MGGLLENYYCGIKLISMSYNAKFVQCLNKFNINFLNNKKNTRKSYLQSDYRIEKYTPSRLVKEVVLDKDWVKHWEYKS